MKTKMTYIAIFSFLFTISSAFAQNVEGGNNNDSNYDALRIADLNKVTNTTQDDESTMSNSAPQNRMAAADMINYQAVARDAGGNLIINTAVTINFDIHEGTAAGLVVFSETQNPMTDANGVFSVQIGSVSALSVDWAGDAHFLEVSLNGTSVGTTEFVSVPYAKSADTMPIDARIGDGASDADVLTISGDNSTVGEILDVRSSVAVTAANDIVNLEMPAGSSDDAQFIEARNNGVAVFQVQGDGRTLINATTTAPQLNTIYGNSIPAAFGTFQSTGAVFSAYGVTSSSQTGTGVYLITLDISAATATSLIPLITAFTSTGAGEMVGYNPVSVNSFEVKIFDENGVAKNSGFNIVVFANR